MFHPPQPGLPDAGDLVGGRYELVSPLARGGMSRIWRAHDRRLGRDVALKILDGRQLADPLHTACIHIEGQALAQLSHPNIAVVHDLGTLTSGTPVPYLVLELVPGKPLSAIGRLLPQPMAISAVAQVADALAAAHARGLVHRDVSAGNVLLTPHGVKLVDFGICAMKGDNETIDGRIMGTIAYLAPERLNDGPVDPAADVYALGVLLYLLLTGELPWPRHADPHEGLAAVAHRRPPRFTNHNGVPSRLGELCQQCLDNDPRQRPTAAQAATRLRDAGACWDQRTATTLLGQPDVVTNTVVFTGPPQVSALRTKHRSRSRKPWRAVLTAAVSSLSAVAAWSSPEGPKKLDRQT
jgi:serine/threonine-protein kinase